MIPKRLRREIGFATKPIALCRSSRDSKEIEADVLKKRLKDEGYETVTNCNGLKMTAADGKQRMTGDNFKALPEAAKRLAKKSNRPRP